MGAGSRSTLVTMGKGKKKTSGKKKGSDSSSDSPNLEESDPEPEEKNQWLGEFNKNSIFVRNLSPQVSEKVLREVFEEADKIDKVTFRAYPNSNNQFFAQIDFVSAKGVIEGVKVSGMNIMDPVKQASQVRTAAALTAAGHDE